MLYLQNSFIRYRKFGISVFLIVTIFAGFVSIADASSAAPTARVTLGTKLRCFFDPLYLFSKTPDICKNDNGTNDAGDTGNDESVGVSGMRSSQSAAMPLSVADLKSASMSASSSAQKQKPSVSSAPALFAPSASAQKPKPSSPVPSAGITRSELDAALRGIRAEILRAIPAGAASYAASAPASYYGGGGGYSVPAPNTASTDYVAQQAAAVPQPWTSNGSALYYSGGNVGIGTTNPAYRLDVSGDMNISAGSMLRYNGQPFAMASTTLFNYFAGGAGNLTMTGTNNTASGRLSLSANTTGIENTAFGNYSLQGNTTGSGNVAIGELTLTSNTTGSNNSANGSYALQANTTGSSNAVLGTSAFYSNTTGSNNVAVGFLAGYNGSVSLQSLSNSTFLGYGANSSLDGVTNSAAIGNGAQVTKSNQVVLGNASVTETILRGNVGIGTSSPSSALTLVGGELEIHTDFAQGQQLFTHSNTGFRAPVINMFRSGGTQGAPTAVPNAFRLGYYTFGGHDGSSYASSVELSSTASQSWTSSAHGSDFFISTVPNDSTSLVERFRINNNGNVGIGSTTPGYRLAVQGSSDMTQMVVRGNSTQTSELAQWQNGTGVPVVRFANSGHVAFNLAPIVADTIINVATLNNERVDTTGTARGMDMRVINALSGNINNITAVSESRYVGTMSSVVGVQSSIVSNAASGNVILDGRGFLAVTPTLNSGGLLTNSYGFYASGQKISGVTNGYGFYSAGASDINYFAGNVGIGTPTPTDTESYGKVLDIQSSTGAALYLRDSDAPTTNYSSLGHYVNDTYLNSESGNLYFRTAHNTKMTVLSGGSVGIGTTTPQGKLHVQSVNNDSVDDFVLSDSQNVKKFAISLDGANGDDYAQLRLYNNNNSVYSTMQTQSGRLNLSGPSGSNGVGLQNSLFVTDAGNVGIGTTTPGQKLVVAGSAQFTGVISGTYGSDLNLTAEGVLTKASSDMRLKENLEALNSSSTLDKLLLLRPYTFSWISDPSHARDVGLIAQDVEAIFPELVFTNRVDGYKGINYSRLPALLVAGMQELARALKEIAMWFSGGKFHVQNDVCVDDVCITKDEFKSMLLKSKGSDILPVQNGAAGNAPIANPEQGQGAGNASSTASSTTSGSGSDPVSTDAQPSSVSSETDSTQEPSAASDTLTGSDVGGISTGNPPSDPVADPVADSVATPSE